MGSVTVSLGRRHLGRYNMKRPQLLILVAVGLLTAYAGRLAWRAHKNIVSLDVHNMAVREVIKKVGRQTWESIQVHNGIDGRITLHVEDQPLNGVLTLIADQCDGNWSIAYPIYTSKAQLSLARKVATGELESPQPGWTNWNQRPNFAAMAARMASFANGSDTNAQPAGGRGMGGFGGPGGMFGGAQSFTPVTTNFSGVTPLEAANALRQFGRVKIVPEDGTERPVNLSINNASMDKAVAQLAKWVARRWAKFYLVEPRGGFRPSPQDREMFSQMPRPDPEQMQQMRQRMEDPNRQARMTQRMLDNIKNTTAEQRAQQRSRRGGGFGGGPGGR